MDHVSFTVKASEMVTKKKKSNPSTTTGKHSSELIISMSQFYSSELVRKWRQMKVQRGLLGLPNKAGCPVLQ